MGDWFKMVKGKVLPANETPRNVPGVGMTRSVWLESGLTVVPNAGGGNCGGHAIASSLRAYQKRDDCVDARGKAAEFADITSSLARCASPMAARRSASSGTTARRTSSRACAASLTSTTSNSLSCRST